MQDTDASGGELVRWYSYCHGVYTGAGIDEVGQITQSAITAVKESFGAMRQRVTGEGDLRLTEHFLRMTSV